MQNYYDQIWREKLSLPQYATLEKRWRSRWEFALGEIDTGSEVLDTGCGDGVFGEMLIRQKGCRVTGLDISQVALDCAQKRGIKTYFCDISRDLFPVESNCYDAVTMLCCLEHIFDPAFALCEALRVLKPGGKALVTLPNAVQLRFRRDFLLGRLSPDLLHTNDGEGLHIRFFNYAGDFDRFVVRHVPALRLVKIIPTLKNPRKHSLLARKMLEYGMKIWPNIFAEYGNYVLVKG